MSTIAKGRQRFVLALALMAGSPSAAFADAASDRITAIANAANTGATQRRTDLLAPAEQAKLEAETVKLIAEAWKAYSEANLNDARRQQIYVEIQALQQRMRIAQHEFDRIARADYRMEVDIARIEGNRNLVRPLILGRSSWKTWVGLESLMEETGDADIIVNVMFDIVVPALPADQFLANAWGAPTLDFPGGNLGELYSFAQRNDFSFRKFGEAHKQIMKVVAMISAAAENEIRELRDVNQAIRLTIARIQQ